MALERVVDFRLHLAPAHEALEAVGGERPPLRGRGAELLAIGSIEIPSFLGPDEGLQAQLLRRAPAEGGIGSAHPDPVLVHVGQAAGADEILARLLLAFQPAVPVALAPAEADLQGSALLHAEGRGAGNLAVTQLLQEGWCRATASPRGVEAEAAAEVLVEPQPKGVARGAEHLCVGASLNEGLAVPRSPGLAQEARSRQGLEGPFETEAHLGTLGCAEYRRVHISVLARVLALESEAQSRTGAGRDAQG